MMHAKMSPLSRLLLLALLLAAPAGVYAQDDEASACQTLVAEALQAAAARCAALGMDQACLASAAVEVESQLDVETFTFEEVGDRLNVGEVEAFRLGAMDLDAGAWGVVRMQLQAGAPAELGEGVTALAFGDVTLANAVDYAALPLTLIEVYANQGSRVRGGPSVNTEVVGGLVANQVAIADGRLADGSWVRIQLPNAEGQRGWVASTLVRGARNLDALKVVVDPDAPPEPAEVAEYGPMQAFTLRTGAATPPCAEAAGGVLVQTPAGAGDVVFVVNGLTLQLASTAYLETPTRQEMAIHLIEGAAQVTAFGVTKIVPAGAQVRAPLGANGEVSGPPAHPEPYDAEALGALPLAGLAREVTVAAALTQAVIDAYNVIPKVGQWQVTLDDETSSCDDERERFPAFPKEPYAISLRFEAGGARILWGQTAYTRVEPGIYEALGSFTFRGDDLDYANTLRIVDEEHIEAEMTLTAENECTLSSTAEVVFAGEVEGES